MNPMRTTLAVATPLATALLVTAAPAQMEMRTADRYDPAAFARATPAVGDETPNLQLPGLDGRPMSLRSLLGRHVVLLKGSYT